MADRPTAKTFRASHRAATHGTLLHDASYTVFLLLDGPLDLLEKALARVSDPAAVSPSSARYRDGSRSCSVDVYYADAYPHGLIGPVEIVWRPAADGQPRQCLVACHPSTAELVRGQLDRTIHAVAAAQQPETSFRLRTIQLCAFELTGPTASDALRRVLEPSGPATDAARLQTTLLAAPAAHPAGLVVGANVLDPRLRSVAERLALLTGAAPHDGTRSA